MPNSANIPTHGEPTSEAERRNTTRDAFAGGEAALFPFASLRPTGQARSIIGTAWDVPTGEWPNPGSARIRAIRRWPSEGVVKLDAGRPNWFGKFTTRIQLLGDDMPPNERRAKIAKRGRRRLSIGGATRQHVSLPSAGSAQTNCPLALGRAKWKTGIQGGTNEIRHHRGSL